MAGVEDQNPAMTTEEIVKLIKDVGRTPIQRDTLYNTIKDYKESKILFILLQVLQILVAGRLISLTLL